MIIDFSNPWVFITWYFITVGLLYASYKTKKSKICLFPVVCYLIVLGLSVVNPTWINDMFIHRVFNFLGLAASLSMFVIMDEVETRRKVISQVFKNRYKKSKLPSDVENLEELEGDEEEEEQQEDE